MILFFLFCSSVIAETFPEKLSETGLYTDIVSKKIRSDALYFEPQYPLWSDGAKKSRFILLPTGEKIDTRNADYWVFPIETKFWKEFRFPNQNGRGFRRVETRYLEKLSENIWFVASYLWNDEETEAHRASVFGVKNYYPLSDGQFHDIPAAKQCRFCHQRGGDLVLGFDALQLSDDRDPLAPHSRLSPRSVTLHQLKKMNLLTFFHEEWETDPPRIYSETALGRASMGYLHGNCGHCHNPGGRAASTGQFLRHSHFATHESEEPAFFTTVNQMTSEFHIPGELETFRILPGKPKQSAVFYRMNAYGEDAMPPLGRKIIDKEALRLLQAWILRLPR